MRLSIILGITASIFSSLALAAPPSSSPSGKASDLICHTDNQADCYPRIFEPTLEFQIIHDDQDIPPGLHVRMDIYSGKKEARLNVPMEGETDYSDLPTEQAMVVVDPPAEEVQEEQQVALRDQQPQKPPAYDNAGKIMPPRPDSEGVVTDAEAYADAIKTLLNAESNADKSEALPVLLELSHDIYYGLELMKNADVLKHLFYLMFSEDHWDAERTAKQHKQAASVLSSAIQNNPTALKAAQESWRSFMPSPGNKSPIAGDNGLVERMLSLVVTEKDPAAARVKLQALGGLVKAPEVRDAFLEQDGMVVLLQKYSEMPHTGGWEQVREKIAQFVSDTFLDADMGAEVGVWPQERSTVDAEECASKLRSGCWPLYHDTFVNQDEEKDHEEWSVPFKKLLDAAFEAFENPASKQPVKEVKVETQAKLILPEEVKRQEPIGTREL